MSLEAKQFCELAQVLPDALLLVESKGAIKAANPAAVRLLNKNHQEIIGQPLSALIVDQDGKGAKYLRACAAQRSPLPGRLRWQTGQGEIVDTRCYGSLLSPPAGANGRDIVLRFMPADEVSDRFTMLNKELETLRLKHHALMHEKSRLEERVAERTAELAHHAAQLEKVNKELDQFAYITSHDLRAPLRAISNLSQWIEEDIGDSFTEETREQMQLLRNRVKRMDGLIEGILEYSRVGRIGIPTEKVDVAELLGEVVDSLSPPEGFTINIPSALPVFTSQRLSLFQVFSNLVGNAVKYRDKPDGTIDITIEDVGDFYQFAVCDDGPGIAPEYHEKVFVIFQTLQPRDEVESTGVGLTLVKKIVNEQGGDIWLESEAGAGAKFIFTWPKTPKNQD